MSDWTFINTKYFTYVDKITFSIDGMQLRTNDTEEYINCTTNNDFIWYNFGYIFKNSLLNRPYFSSTAPLPSRTTFLQKVHDSLESLDLLFFSLWFVKDNCCKVDQIGAYQHSESLVTIVHRTSSYSNALGLNAYTDISLNDFDMAIKYRDKYLDLVDQQTSPDFTNQFQTGKLMEDRGFTARARGSFVSYNEMNRLSRAIQFLRSARGTSRLVTKISFYVLVLECLFSANDLTEISRKISERASKYITGDADERLKTSKFVKKLYSIRSKYVHGQVLDNEFKNNEKLSSVSIETDALIRRILIKILDEDSEMFLLNDVELTRWFNSIPFRKY